MAEKYKFKRPDLRVKGKLLFDNTKISDIGKGFTLVLCFSRAWCVKPFFDAFQKLQFDKQNCHLLLFDNTDNKLLQDLLLPLAETFAKDFLSVRYYKSFRQGGYVFRFEKNDNFFKSKIYPIAQMQFDIADLVTTKTFVQLEDDEIPTNPKTIPRLLELLKRKNVGIATGVSTARNPELKKVGIGVHKAVEVDGYRIIKRVNFDPNTKGVKEAQATGFYCFATYLNLWHSALSHVKKTKSRLPHWGFDTYVTNWIYRQGYKILADFSLWCDHIQVVGGKIYRFNAKDAVAEAYVYVPELKAYARCPEKEEPIDASNF
jgi:hypothetical protein